MTAASSTYEELWRSPRGWRAIAAVNHKEVGRRFVKTGFIFFVVGGILALLMRIQLGSPENTFLDPQTYNELFTMHGTTMMFLFAVPFMEGVANYLLPLMLGTRDLPFPRFNAFNYWCYLFGGLLLYSSFVVGAVPDGGWFAYTPLTDAEFSPGLNIDLWLIGITLVEISGIGAAAEILVSILRTRAPGMTLMRMPIFAWAMLIVSIMILFAFTTLATASIMLELDRKFATGFYDTASGGSPLLWQHLFWIFGHPEVYIMFLPAAGIASHVVQTFARRPLVGYGWVVFAIITTGFLSFGLWVHHMFTVGLPTISLTFFAASSLVIGIASGIQVVAWIATLWRGRIRSSTALLFVYGFIVTFVIGGVTGIMVASVPFDWQVHDTHFVVAHFHYVLLGGVVFPAFAGIYYWFPKLTGKLLNERLGQWNFWLMFTGFNVTFLPMHLTGLWGMPRRVYTYSSSDGWTELNLVSTIGAFLIAAGVGAFLVNYLTSRTNGGSAGDDPWAADTLEWATTSPPSPYNFLPLPVVRSRHPLWEPETTTSAERGRLHETADQEHPWRVALGTSAVDAEAEEVTLLPVPTLWPFIAAVALSVAGIGLLIDIYLLCVLGVLGMLGAFTGWWVTNERAYDSAIDTLGTTTMAPAADRTLGAWGVKMVMVVLGTMIGTITFSYLYIALQSSSGWPLHPAGEPEFLVPIIVALLASVLTAAGVRARRRLVHDRPPSMLWSWVGTLACVAIATAVIVEIVNGDNALGVNAYGSLVAILLSCLALIALIGAGFGLWSVRGCTLWTQGYRQPVLMVQMGAFWYFVAGAAIAVVLVYAAPSFG